MNNQDTAARIVKRKRGEIFYIGISFTSVIIFFIVWEIAQVKA